MDLNAFAKGQIGTLDAEQWAATMTEARTFLPIGVLMAITSKVPSLAR